MGMRHGISMRCTAAAAVATAAVRVKNYKMILRVANVLNLKSHDLLMEVFVTFFFCVLSFAHKCVALALTLALTLLCKMTNNEVMSSIILVK